MTSIAIAVFAKTPGLSPLKTRLAASIGTEKAHQFYRLSLQCTEACLQALQSQYDDIDVYWAVAEAQHREHDIWHNKQTLWTGPGSLGQRLHHVYQELKARYDTVILIGSDCPQLRPATFIDTIKQLQHSEYVMGPAEDGGFYLFASHQPIDADIWTQCQYSQPDTRKQLINNINEPVHLLQAQFDIDTVSELNRLTTVLPSSPALNTDAQQQLYCWLEEYGHKQD